MENENVNPLDIEIKDLRFKMSARLWNCLWHDNMETLGDVVKLEACEWLRCPGFGRLTLKELEDFLATYGLQLKAGRLPPRELAADKVKKLERALREIARVNNSRDRYSDEIDRIILKALEI